MKRTIARQEVERLIDEGREPVIIDVRRPEDYDADPGMIPGALRREPDKVDLWWRELPQDKDILIYCARGGSVSNAVLDKLLAHGVPARYLEGGLEAWKKAAK